MKTLLFIFTLLFQVIIPSFNSVADNYAERRIQAGSKIFRSLVAADMDVTKKANAEGQLVLALVYQDHPEASQKAADTLQFRSKPIQQLPLKITTVALDELAAQQPTVAGIFLTEALSTEDLKSVIEYSAAHSVVLYSPFEGHVEQGVPAGLSVEARIQPYLNLNALNAANLRIKPFFLKVSKLHE